MAGSSHLNLPPVGTSGVKLDVGASRLSQREDTNGGSRVPEQPARCELPNVGALVEDVEGRLNQRRLKPRRVKHLVEDRRVPFGRPERTTARQAVGKVHRTIDLVGGLAELPHVGVPLAAKVVADRRHAHAEGSGGLPNDGHLLREEVAQPRLGNLTSALLHNRLAPPELLLDPAQVQPAFKEAVVVRLARDVLGDVVAVTAAEEGADADHRPLRPLPRKGDDATSLTEHP